LDLVPRPLDQKPIVHAQTRVEEIKNLYEQVKARIEKSNLSYQTLDNKHKKEGYLLMRKSCMDSFKKGKISFQKKEQTNT